MNLGEGDDVDDEEDDSEVDEDESVINDFKL